MDRMEGIRAKIERANKHIKEFEAAADQFLTSDAYKVSTKPHLQLPDATTFYVERADPVPPCIPAIVGDAIQNLRSALDYLACRLVEANGAIVVRQTGFPIWDPDADWLNTEEKIAKFFEGKVKGMAEPMKKAIRNANPYKRGNDSLWAIHELNITDKHKLLIATGFTVPDLTIRSSRYSYMFPDAPWYRMKVGDEILTIPRKLEPDEYPEFRFDIVLSEAGCFQDKPLLKSLSTMLNVVENLVADFAPFLL